MYAPMHEIRLCRESRAFPRTPPMHKHRPLGLFDTEAGHNPPSEMNVLFVPRKSARASQPGVYESNQVEVAYGKLRLCGVALILAMKLKGAYLTSGFSYVQKRLRFALRGTSMGFTRADSGEPRFIT